MIVERVMPYLAVALLAGGASTAAKVVQIAWTWCKNRLLFTVEFNSGDPAYPWVKQWVGANGRSRFVAASAVYPESSGPTYGNRRKPTFCLFPRGVCVIRFRGKRLIAWHDKEALQFMMDHRETITLQFLRGEREDITAILTEAYELAHGIDGQTTEVWLYAGHDWHLADRKPARSIETVVLADGVGNSIVSDGRAFLVAREWYRARGIPWHRGYLFHGPPGTGKSSLAMALASELRLDVSVLSLSAFTSDSELARAMSDVPPNRLVLLEDVDAAWSGRTGAERVTFSGLLNVIDGATAKEGRILVMTTNHQEKLDPALIRPGRADMVVELGNATRRQAADLYGRFFPLALEAEAQAFGEEWAGRSPAAIQEELLRQINGGARPMTCVLAA